MMKVAGSLLFAAYVIVTVDLLVLYNYNNEKIISDAGYTYDSMNGCPIKPEKLHLSDFYYSNQGMHIQNLIAN